MRNLALLVLVLLLGLAAGLFFLRGAPSGGSVSADPDASAGPTAGGAAVELERGGALAGRSSAAPAVADPAAAGRELTPPAAPPASVTPGPEREPEFQGGATHDPAGAAAGAGKASGWAQKYALVPPAERAAALLALEQALELEVPDSSKESQQRIAALKDEINWLQVNVDG
ncbi:MAG: hypothetical protein JNK02_08760 [Planctomycetes bacterium]|nr:hypothetical protein [Planctomycetota bacterium]